MNYLKKKSVQTAVAAALLIPAAAIGIAAFSWKLNVVNYTLATEKFTKPVRIVMLSDLHASFYGENQVDLIDAIKKQTPDMIIFAGDILVDDMPHLGPIMLLEGIKDLCPCYASAGNHELIGDDKTACKKIFHHYGIGVVESEYHTVTVNGQTMDICGLEDHFAGYNEFQRQVEELTAFKSPHYSLLISHHPEFVELFKKMDFDLILSGHAHGGQWRIPYLLNGVFAPDQGFFPKYAGGLYTHNNTKQIVGRGLVKFYVIPRIFNRPELVVVDIIPK